VSLIDILFIVSILSCALVTGFIFTYAIVVMPGISKLNDKDFIRAFQVTDAVIQNNHPLFMLAWVGSIISLFGLNVMSILTHGLTGSWALALIGAIYLIGVQGLTVTIHLPLNNRLKAIEVDIVDNDQLSKERMNFEPKWNYYNSIRTGISFAVSVALLILMALQ